MINLLPTDYRHALLFARRNTSLRGWVIALMSVLIGVLMLVAAGYFYLQNEVNKQNKSLDSARQDLQAQNIDGVKKEVDEISSNTRLVIQVLQREVLFSKLIRQLGASLPSGTALTNIALGDDVKGGITLEAVATNFTSASQIQVNLEDPENKIFSDADIENISCNGTEVGDQYPCLIQIRALFNEDNPYVYIKQTQPANNGETR